ncbi:complement resistance protein TraT [Vreelandella alkaliphila]|uniref:complement resistance protein TraT n=1 Tax=Halomonadaceae TaxID=28256 RepID=UPI001D003252|nr:MULTISPECIES: complement resistance protein TraT [unclassified Halomonas]
MLLKKNLLIAGAMAGVMLLSGCAATHTAINKRELAVSTKMSDTIFLDPVPLDEQVVYVQLRNTSDHQEIDIETSVISAIEAKGYEVTRDLDDAQFLIQANVLQIGETDLRDASQAVGAGYGAALTGAALGGTYVGGGSGRVGTAIAGALIGAAADAMVKDVKFSMITDVRVSRRVDDGITVTEQNQANLSQGSSGTRSVQSTSATEWQRYDTRIASVANKMNLDFEEALPELEQGLTDAISGLL